MAASASPTAIAGVAFAYGVRGTGEVDSLLHVDPPGRRRLLAVVEPVEFSGRGPEVAAAALAALVTEFHDAGAVPPAQALARAFAVANAAVREENRVHGGVGQVRRFQVGACALVLEPRRLTIAQVPPSQAIVVFFIATTPN